MAERSSKKQQQLLEFIDDFVKQHGYGPSYREIMSGLGYKSVSTVAVHVNGLLAKGYIRKRDNSARSIEIVSLRHDDTAPVVKSAPQPAAEPRSGPATLQNDLTELLVEKIKSLRQGELSPEDDELLLKALELVGGEKQAAELRNPTNA